MKRKSFLLLFLIVVSTLGWAATNVEGQEEPKLYVYPPSVSVSPGETFTVDVKIANVMNLYTYQFNLMWEPDLLDVIDVTEGPFLNAEGTYATSFTPRIYNTPDPFGVSGYVYVACTLLGEPASAAASGSGTLATLEFLVKKEGITSLHLYETKLISSLIVEMTHETEDGSFQYLPPEAPEINVKPSSVADVSLLPGSVFSVNMSVIQAVEVYTWSLDMSWDPALLNVTNVEEGTFLNQGVFNTTFNRQILQEEGRLYANCSLFEEPPEVSASGNGTLISVTFLVEAVGSTILDLYDTKLLDFGGSEAFHWTGDGYFDNTGAHRDVSIVSVEASPTTVKAGDSVSITVVAGNDGDVTEDFDVIVYWGDINIGTLSTSDLSPGAQKTLTFSWKTEGMAEGNHTIKAVASTVIGEIDTDDNTYVNGYVVITPPEHRDVSIVSVEASPTTVKAGDSVSITVVAGNDGDVTEDFDVIVYWGDINIGTLSTSDLSPGAQKTLTFSWKTEGMAEGNHTIKAVASTVIWEANTDDNTYVNGDVTITPPEETSSLPVTLIAAVVIVILIVVAVTGVVFLRKRR